MEKEKKFEDKMKELEEIINELENGEIDLEKSIDQYTKAVSLIKDCDKQLKTIEENVNKMVSENGELVELPEME